MTRELNSLLARLEDVVERMPDCFNTYEFAQKLALQHQREFLPRVTPWPNRRGACCGCCTRRLPRPWPAATR